MVRTGEGSEFVVADIPGLIEGASEGRGLGHRFLRHIERTRVLVILLDLSATAPASPDRQLAVLLEELGRYQPALVNRPRLVVGSKADVAADASRSDTADLDGVVSAVTGEGIASLVGRMADTVRAARQSEPEPSACIVHRPGAEGVRVERQDDGSFRVVGRQAERAVAFNDLTNPNALDEAWTRLRRLGVHRALGRAGAGSGDIVIIGALEFEYEPED